MEVIGLPGCTPEEKLKIATRHLIPRVLEQHGLSSNFLTVPKDMVRLIIQRHTREAGVRNLERNLAALARAAAVKLACQEDSVPTSKQVTMSLLATRFANSAEAEMKNSTPGVAVGLVWTSFDGEVQFVEASSMVGKGDLHLTGQLGDVIKESAQIALTWVRARSTELKLVASTEINFLENRDVHVHFPSSAIPKDGPSAGVTLVTALVSLFSQRTVRSDTAMTGEMTLGGLVLPVGVIKDKVLAAHRSGLKRVILPEKNLKDLAEVPAAVLSCTKILSAKRVGDVLEHAFEGGFPWRKCSRL